MRKSDDLEKRRFEQLLHDARDRIQALEAQIHPTVADIGLRSIDRFLASSKKSHLEKAFYLLLSQFYTERRPYFFVTGERVRVPNIYDYSGPNGEYELDFAIYSGTKKEPVKIALECDGILSHRRRHNPRDRRKDVNLQAAGWIVLRFGADEIQTELRSLAEKENHVSSIVEIVDNIVESVGGLLTANTYADNAMRTRLTGLPWGSVTCPSCGEWQNDIVGRMVKCRHCGMGYKSSADSKEDV